MHTCTKGCCLRCWRCLMQTDAHTMPTLLAECTREQRLFRSDSELPLWDVDSVNTQTEAVVNPRLLRGKKRRSSPATLRLYDLTPPPGQTTAFSRRPGCGAACIHACIIIPSSALCKDFPPWGALFNARWRSQVSSLVIFNDGLVIALLCSPASQFSLVVH